MDVGHDDSGRTDGEGGRSARRSGHHGGVGGAARGAGSAGNAAHSARRGGVRRTSPTAGRGGVSHAGTPGPYRDGALTLAEGAGLLEEVGEDFAALNRLYAGLIDKVGALARGGVVEQLEGMTLDRFLSVAHRVTGSDVWLLETAARVLEVMPVTSTWFRAGVVSWSQLRRIVTGARDLSGEHREILDRRIAASGHLLEGAGAEAFLDAVDVAVDELHGRAAVERREQREARNSFLTVQARLFGGVSLYGEFDTTAGATIVNALDAASQSAAKNTEPAGAATTRAKQRARGLVELSAAFLGGTTASGRTREAKPQLIVHVPLGRTTATAAGRVELNLPGAGLPTVTARTLEALNTDADLRAVIFDGARPLGVSDQIHASDIPVKARIAVKARDRGGRFPASTTPAGHCDLDHHARPRRAGGSHDPDGLALLGRPPHRRRETHGWTAHLDHHTGAMVWRRAGRTWVSWPWGTPLADDPGPDPDHDDGGQGRDPPVPF